MNVLLIDNFDSFTYNLVDEFEKRSCKCLVYRNNVPIEKIHSVVKEFNPGLIVISPGPGNPGEAGNCIGLIKAYSGKLPIFGVCLGHQCIIEAFGGKIGKANETVHGKPSNIFHDGKGIFSGLESPFQAARYHSLTGKSIPNCLEATANSKDEKVMAVRHRDYFVKGVQFHPESILTTAGGKIIENVIRMCGEKKMIEELTEKVENKENLSREETKALFEEIMSGKVETGPLADFLKALAEKGETIEEVIGAAESMRAVVAEVKPAVQQDLLDIVGTGGDKKNTINVSTASAFVAAGAGCIVAKHGNRSISSKCGSADVLEKLGVKIDLPPAKNQELVEKAGIAFLFAPCHHPAMKHAMPARKKLGIRTIFNILGPITNPASAQTYLLGVFDAALTEKLAQVLAGLGTKHALVVHGNDGFDEISLSDATTMFEVKGREVKRFEITPEQFGFERCEEKDVAADTVEENAEILKAILSGKETGPKASIVLLNAGAGIYVNGMAASIEEGVEKAKQSISSGNALKKLEQLVEESQR